MQQHAAALHVAEKAIAEADALVRALDQARYIGEHEFAAVGLGDAELRIQRGERIVGDLRLGRTDRGKEGRFPRIRQADDAGIGDELEPQADGKLLAGLAGIGVAGRAIGRGFEVRIAEAAIAAAGEEGALAGFGQIGDQGRAIFFVDLRADRHLEHGVGAARAVAVLAHAAAAVLRLEVLLVAIVDERVEALDRLARPHHRPCRHHRRSARRIR